MELLVLHTGGLNFEFGLSGISNHITPAFLLFRDFVVDKYRGTYRKYHWEIYT